MNSSRTLETCALSVALVFLFVLLSCWPAIGGAFHSVSGPPAAPGATNAPETLLKEMLSVKQTGSNTYRLGLVEFDKASRIVSIPARVRIRKDVVEYGLVTEQGKAYESVLTTAARPADIHVACLLLGRGSAPVTGDFNKPALFAETNAVFVEVVWETNGQPVRVRLSDLVCLTSGHPEPTAPTMKLEKWLYNGSVVDQSGFAAQREGSIISLIRDPVALVNNPGTDRDNDDIHFPNAKLLPPESTPVRVEIRFAEGAGR